MPNIPCWRPVPADKDAGHPWQQHAVKSSSSSARARPLPKSMALVHLGAHPRTHINCSGRLGPQWEALMPVTPIEERLASLQAHYAERIDAAVAAGRMDLVRDLADDYEDEALELILESGTSSQPDSRTVEILEFGGAW